jgi:acetyl esterase/lipase
MTDGLPRLKYPLPEEREGREADESLQARRQATGIADPAKVAKYPRIAGVPCLVVGDEAASRIILHMHGGGYRLGYAAGWTGFAARLAAEADARVILPEYALAPERPFPGAVLQTLRLIGALTSAEAAPVFLSGDSAGGGLALAAAVALANPGCLAGVVLLSPWIDLRVQASSYARCAQTDGMFSQAAAFASAGDYLQGWRNDDPMTSPLLADFAGLPPVCILASSTEVLADDSAELARLLAISNVPVSLLMRPGLPHDWPIVTPEAGESAHALQFIANFVSSDWRRDDR